MTMQFKYCVGQLYGNRNFLFFNQNLISYQKKIRYYSSTEVSDVGNMLSEWDRAKPFEEIPTISRLSLYRNILPGGKYIGKGPYDFISKIREEYGDIFYMPGMIGKKNIVIAHNPEDFEKVFRTEGQWPFRRGIELIDYHRSNYRKDFFQGIEGIITTQGEKWGKFRTAVNPVLLQPRNIKVYIPKLSKVNAEFIERIKEIRDPKTFEVPHDFEEEINRFTLESISVVALDKKIGLIKENRENPDAKKLFENLKTLFRISAIMELKIPLWKLFSTPKYKQAMNALDNINEVTQKYVNEAVERLEKSKENAEKRPEYEKSILEKLLQIDKKIATVMAMDMLMGGVDTTSSAIAGILLCLAKNPEKQNKLRKEIQSILPNKDSSLTEADIGNVPYLRACIKEGMRMYPLTNANGRTAGKDIVLSGYRIPKGTEIAMFTMCLLRDPKYYPNPNDYMPERWLRQPKRGVTEACQYSSHKNIHPFANLPFGFGPRSCVGRRIVDLEMEGVLARIIRNFNVEFNYSTDNAFKNVLINIPAIPLKFKFTDLVD